MRVRSWTAAAVVAVLGLAALTWLGRGGPSGGRGASTIVSQPAAALTPTPASHGTPTPTYGAVPPPEIAVAGGRLTGGDTAGAVRWELRARTLETDASRQQVRLEGVEGKFFERGRAVLTVAAASAVFSVGTQDLTLSGEVRALAQGRSLTAGRVQWLAARRLLVATGGVVLVQDRITVRADRLESDIGLRRARLSGNIRVTVRD